MSGRIQRDAQFPKRGPGELAGLVAPTNRAQDRTRCQLRQGQAFWALAKAPKNLLFDMLVASSIGFAGSVYQVLMVVNP